MVRGTWHLGVHPAWVFPTLVVVVHLAGCWTHARPCSPVGDDVCQGQLGADGCWPSTVTCADGHQPTTPVDYARCALDGALAEAHSTARVQVAVVGDAALVGKTDTIARVLDAHPESYLIIPLGDATWIVGRDAVGAMYGALEVAERLRFQGACALPLPEVVRGAPAVSLRAANPFLVLPEQSETDWWFLDEQYWTQYLDLLAHARFNFLDIHGMYDLGSTLFPNALLYFARSPSFPDVGAPAADRERNLAALNRVIALATARGIKVGLMSYNALTSLDGASADAISDDAVKIYTREAAQDLATRAPGLARLGFRIGESSRPASWYGDTFIAGVEQAGTGVAPYTRTWGASKTDILSLQAMVGDGLAGESMVVEAKYNGEHWGAPYAIAGGWLASFGAYSYQDFLNPPTPYDFLFQVRAGGTHRIFRQASYARTRRTVQSLAFSPAVRGFTLEPPQAYFPQRDGYHAQDSDRFSPWTFARDEMMFLLWGRLSYDPDTPEDLFRAMLARETGGDFLWDAMQAAGEIVPWIQTAHTCGPDSRNFAPELELGGDVASWTTPPGTQTASCYRQGAFDTFAIAGPDEVAADLVAGSATSRLSPVEVAARVLDAADRAALAGGAPDDNLLARDIVRECHALADLGHYFGHKLRGATALAVYQRVGISDWLSAARAETTTADDAWRQLADDTSYISPFADHLRMLTLGYDPFHWSEEVPALDADPNAIDVIEAQVVAAMPIPPATMPAAEVWLRSSRPQGPGLAELSIVPSDPAAATWLVRVSFTAAVPADAKVRVLWKPFQSEVDWSVVGTTAAGVGSYSASVAGGGAGGLFAVEVLSAQGGWRYPDPERETPYLSLPP